MEGRKIDLKKKGKNWDAKEHTSIEIARKYNHKEVASLLERFAHNHSQTRQEVCLELGLLDKDTAELFATTVFLCDDYFTIKINNKAAHFFKIIKNFQWNFQMIVCNRVYGSKKETILSKDSEKAFRSIVRCRWLYSIVVCISSWFIFLCCSLHHFLLCIQLLQLIIIKINHLLEVFNIF